MPRRAAFPTPAAIAVGVASANAHGQKTTRIVTPRISAVRKSVSKTKRANAATRIAQTIAAGTMRAAQRSAMRWIGAFFASASRTSRIRREIVFSAFGLETRIVSAPDWFHVPASTASPTNLSTGTLSPVRLA